MSYLIPKGKLVAVGGNEQKKVVRERTAKGKEGVKNRLAVLHRIVQEAKGSKTHIEIIPTASAIPDEIAHDYEVAYKHLKCREVGVMNIRRQGQTDSNDYIERLQRADAIMFTGGDQRKIATAFCDTRFLEILQQRYLNEPNFVIAGTSAGAMAMSQTMLYGGDSEEALMKGIARLDVGLGLIPSVIIDSHFINRGRFGRLAVAVAHHPQLTGIGLGEDTGVIIREGRYLECIGSGLVCLFEGHDFRYKNLHPIGQGNGLLSLENMIMHFMVRGHHYDMTERRFVQPITKIVERELIH